MVENSSWSHKVPGSSAAMNHCCIEDERIKCTGYVFSRAMTPRHWFQFADDSAIVTATEKDSQNLLNVFNKWCEWAHFTLRIDKCCTFGIKKNGQKSNQFKPYLRINGLMIPCVEMGDSFRYLGKFFSFDMSPDKIKEELVLKVTTLMDKIDRIPLHPHKKLRIINLYLYSKIRWVFSIYDISCTWVIQSLDSVMKSYVKRWLHLPQGANFNHITLPSSMMGLEFQLPSQVYQYCKVSIRKTLKKSSNEDINLLYALTKPKNYQYDVHAENDNPKKALKTKITNNIENHLKGLKEGNAIRSCMQLNSTSTLLAQWKVVQQNLPGNIFVFSRKALIFSLANKTNLLRWKISSNDLCELCDKKETQLHHMKGGTHGDMIRFYIRYTIT